MRELEQLRRINRERAQRAVGVYRGANLVTKAHVANAQADHDVERLPEAWSTAGSLQSAGGGWYFTIDLSVIDGPDLIG